MYTDPIQFYLKDAAATGYALSADGTKITSWTRSEPKPDMSLLRESFGAYLGGVV